MNQLSLWPWTTTLTCCFQRRKLFLSSLTESGWAKTTGANLDEEDDDEVVMVGDGEDDPKSAINKGKVLIPWDKIKCVKKCTHLIN